MAFRKKKINKTKKGVSLTIIYENECPNSERESQEVFFVHFSSQNFSNSKS